MRLFIWVSLLLGSQLMAQTSIEVSESWFYGSSGEDRSFGMDIGPTENIFLGGSTRGYGASILDYLIMRVDSSGNLLWERTFSPSAQGDNIFRVLATADGGCLATGYCRPRDTQIAIYKLDESGGLEWHSLYGGPSADYSSQILPALDGGYLVLGTYWVNGAYDMQLIKIDEAGSQQWRKIHSGGPANESAVKVLPTAAGDGYVVFGHSESPEMSYGGMDAVAFRFDIDGNEQLRTHYGGVGHDRFWSALHAPDGGYYTVGSSQNGPNGGWDLMITRLTASLEEEWTHYYGYEGDEFGYDILQLEEGGLLAAGSSSNSSGETDAFFIHVGPDGQQMGTLTVPDPGNEEVRELRSLNGEIFAVLYSSMQQQDFHMVKLVLQEDCIVLPSTGNCNQPPIAVDKIKIVYQDTPRFVNVAVLDSDPDDNLYYGSTEILQHPTHGSLTSLGYGAYTYSSDPGFLGDDYLTYRICDWLGLCDEGRVTLQVITGN